MVADLQFLDTNVILRYLLNDIPDQALCAAKLIEGDQRFTITLAVVAEVAFGLRKVYGVPRERVVDELIGLLDRANVSVYEVPTALAIEALRLCRPSGRVSIGDAVLWATARASGGVVWTVDERFPTERIDVRMP